MRLSLLVLFLVPALSLAAQTTSQRLDTVAAELDAIVAQLEKSSVDSDELQVQLARLETLSAEHQATLREQDRLLADYRTTVAALEAHDRASLELAENLRGQLQAERTLSGWLWPVAGGAVAVAIVEALVLGLRR